MSYPPNKIVTYRDGAWISTATATGAPGVDPAWHLLAQGLPTPRADGDALVVSGGRWISGILPGPVYATPYEMADGTRDDVAVTPYGLKTALAGLKSLADTYKGQWVQP